MSTKNLCIKSRLQHFRVMRRGIGKNRKSKSSSGIFPGGQDEASPISISNQSETSLSALHSPIEEENSNILYDEKAASARLWNSDGSDIYILLLKSYEVQIDFFFKQKNPLEFLKCFLKKKNYL